MIPKRLLVFSLVLLLTPGALGAEDYRVEAFDGAPPDDLAPAVVAKLSTSALRIVQGDKLVCEIWPAKQWAVQDGFTPSLSILYPLEPGSLVGALRFPRKSTDFRNQDIARGAYTLRYGNQPEDGNHVGTFDTRDFLLLTPADADSSAEPIEQDELFSKSAEAAGSSHPAIMPLLQADAQAETPGMRHQEQQDWWSVRFAGPGSDGKKHVVELVVGGHSLE